MTDAPERHLTRQGESRKSDILRCAETLFAERGYEQTRVADIMKAAGVAKGLFYWYFETKEAVLAELILDLRERLRQTQQAAVAPYERILERLYVGTKVSIEFVIEHFEIYGMIQRVRSGEGSFAKLLGQSNDRHAEDTAALLAAGQEQGVVRRSDSPLVMAHVNAGTVTHIAFLAYHGGFRGDPVRAARAGARYVVHAVAADKAMADEVIARLEGRTSRQPA